MRSALGLCLALALALGLAACEPAEADPVDTAKAYNVAVRSGDSKRVLELIDASAVERIDSLAQGASDQVGGRRKVEAHEMLEVVDVERAFELSRAELLDNDGTVAHVALESTTGERHILELVYQGDRWRVKVPLPGEAAASTETPSGSAPTSSS